MGHVLWLKAFGALLIFVAWGVSTFLQNQAREAAVRFRSVHADLITLQRYANSALDHQQIAKDLAVITRSVSVAAGEENPQPLSSLALLQSVNAQSSTIRILRYSADKLAELSRVIDDRPLLGDSIVALVSNITALEDAHNRFIDSLLALTATNSEIPQSFYVSAQQQQTRYLSLQHAREEELIDFYARTAEESEAAAKRADKRAQLGFLAATLLFSFGTILLLWHDFAEARKPTSAGALGRI